MQLICKELLAKIRNNPVYKVYNETIISKADKILDERIEVLSYQDHMFFYREHYRSDGQKTARRENLSLLSLAYLLTKKEEYLLRAEDYIWAICDEFAWAVPAHLKEEGLVNAVPFETQPQYIELLASGTVALLAEVDAALGDALSWRIRSRIRMEAERRIFTPFETRLHNLFWERTVHNWASVCSSNLGIAYIHLCDKERVTKILPRLKKSIANFLDGYDSDGCCLEGYAYWNYGFGEFIQFADLLYRYTEGKDNYFLDEKVHQIALYGQRVMVGDYRVVNFADGQDNSPIQLAKLHLLASYYDDIILPNKERYNFGTLEGKMATSFLPALRNYLWINPERDGNLGERSYHYYMDKAEWFIEKNARYSFVAKGGHNAEPYLTSHPDWRERYENRADRNEPHNHNDVGHFIFYHENECIFCDLGAGLYYVDYFFPEHRYKYLPSSSRGHSVPIVDGQEQCRDIYHGAKLLSVDDTHFTIDIAGAYEVDGLTSLVRSFSIDKDGVIIKDTYTTEAPLQVTERFVTKIKPEQKGNILSVGSATLTIPDGVTYTLHEEAFVSHDKENVTAYLLDFSFVADGERQVCFRME